MLLSSRSGYIKFGIIALSVLILIAAFPQVKFGSTQNFKTTCWGEQDSLMKHVLYCNKTNVADSSKDESFDIAFDSRLRDFSINNYHISVLQSIPHSRSCSLMPDSDGMMPNDCEWKNVTDECLVDGISSSWCVWDNSTGSDVCEPADDLSNPISCPSDNRTRICNSLSGDACQYEAYADEPRTYYWDEWVAINSDFNEDKFVSDVVSYSPGETKTFRIEWETPVYKNENGWGSSGNWSINPVGWWNDTWVYRRNITVSNSGGNLTNYQVKIVANLSDSKQNMSQSCDDIRFTYYNSTADNQTELNYWIEYCNLSASDNITVWVNVTYLQNNTNTTLYIYYGNPSAQNLSNGSKTFLYFEDFSSGNSSNWQCMKNDGSGDPATLNASSGYIVISMPSTGNNEYCYMNSWANLSNWSMEAMALVNHTNTNYNHGLGGFINTVSGGNGFITQAHAINGYEIYKLVSGTYTQAKAVSMAPIGRNAWSKVRFDFTNISNTAVYNSTYNGTNAYTDTGIWGYAMPSISVWTTNTGSYVYWYDNVFVRKFYGYDPVVVVGAAEPNNFTETDARNMINLGIYDSLGNLTNYTDQQIYARYANTEQDNGTFDVVVIYGNQTWAFNYITFGETAENMSGIGKTLNIWENQSLDPQQVRQQVSGFINFTKTG
jgi:hypothetical protein